MTRARSVGAKRRNRKGRPRKEGVARYENGRIKRDQSKPDLTAPALRKRCEMMGWKPTEKHLARARGQHLATAWGRLYEAQKLTRPMYEALEAYSAALGRYRAALGCPAPKPTPCRYGDTPAGGGEGMPTAARQKFIKEFEAAEVALRDAGSDARLAVDLVMEEQPADIEALRLGAKALARHFQIEG